MDKNMVANILKTHRMTSGLSAQEVISKLRSKGIHLSEKTLYGYENGVSLPNVPTFIALCDIYDIDDILGESKRSSIKICKSGLAVDEWSIDQYDDFFNADLYGKILLLMKWGVPSFAGYEKKLEEQFPQDSTVANFNRLYSLFAGLNESAQGRLFEYANDLAKNPDNLVSSPTTSEKSAG